LRPVMRVKRFDNCNIASEQLVIYQMLESLPICIVLAPNKGCAHFKKTVASRLLGSAMTIRGRHCLKRGGI
jgi:hypothetical protein